MIILYDLKGELKIVLQWNQWFDLGLISSQPQETTSVKPERNQNDPDL